jgi:hypothetical protein
MSRAAPTNTANNTAPNPASIGYDVGDTNAGTRLAGEGFVRNGADIGSVASSSHLESSQEVPSNQSTGEQGNVISIGDAPRPPFMSMFDISKHNICLVVELGTWNEDL